MGETRTVLSSVVSTNDDVATALGGIEKLFDQFGFNLAVPRNRAWFLEALQGGPGVAMAKLDGLITALRAKPMLPPELDEDDLNHVAEQRAMRIACVVLGTITKPLPADAPPGLFAFNEEGQRLVADIMRVWLDTFISGLKLQSPASHGRFTQH